MTNNVSLQIADDGRVTSVGGTPAQAHTPGHLNHKLEGKLQIATFTPCKEGSDFVRDQDLRLVRVVNGGGETVAELRYRISAGENEKERIYQYARLIAAAPETAAERDRLKEELAFANECGSRDFAEKKALQATNAKLLEALKRHEKNFEDEFPCDDSHSYNKETLILTRAAIAETEG